MPASHDTSRDAGFDWPHMCYSEDWDRYTGGAQMHGGIGRAKLSSSALSGGTIRIATRSEIESSPRWQTAFAGERKDSRFYELLEDTVEGFDYGYLVAGGGEDICAIQPYFIVDQDLAAGTSGHAKTAIAG